MEMSMKYLSVCVLLLAIRSGAGDKHTPGQDIQFRQHDANHDSCLEKHEFTSIFMAMDTSHDGKITVAEAYKGWHNFHFSDYKDSTFFFREIDRDRDTYITQSDVDFLFSTFDVNNDACISLNEYHLSWNSFFNE